MISRITGAAGTPWLTEVLRRAWHRPFRTQSDFARQRAQAVAAAACLGLITTASNSRRANFTNLWRVTPSGLRTLWQSDQQQGDDHD